MTKVKEKENEELSDLIAEKIHENGNSKLEVFLAVLIDYCNACDRLDILDEILIDMNEDDYIDNNGLDRFKLEVKI